ncbi:MAG: hypothetical protein IBJ11_08330 [Phycisphaerales bacterium]|nr:hypothetical protein [Phycisphaerales bacterium]
MGWLRPSLLGPATPPRPAAAAGPGEPRALRCYHCWRDFTISPRAVSARCPLCTKGLQLADVVVTGVRRTAQVQTCGWVIVEPKGHLTASRIEAGLGVRVMGELRLAGAVGAAAAAAITAGPLILGPSARWAGNGSASRLLIDEGAVIEGGRFAIQIPVGAQLAPIPA